MGNSTSSPQDHKADVPKIHFGNKAADYVHEVIDNCVWRKAVSIDGKLYWATSKPGELGELITDGSYKVRHYRDYILLAPKDGLTDEDPDAGAERISQ